MISLFTILCLIPPVAADLDWEYIVKKAQEISTAGILGLIDTDLLFAKPGTTQKEQFRILQALLGIGSLRVVFRIVRFPCLLFLHEAFGIKPPEAVWARECWLDQESWTQMSGLGMTVEDTSYHRINQGCGPQAKILWDEEQIQEEEIWWQVQPSNPPIQTQTLAEDGPLPNIFPAAAYFSGRLSSLSTSGSYSEGVDEKNYQPRPQPRSRQASSQQEKGSRAVAPDVFHMRSGEGISVGTTDKWWMDRWQCEVLAVASIHHISVADSCTLLTNAYFGNDIGIKRHFCAGICCCLLTVGTLLVAMWTKWSWIPQFFALSVLGYFLNWTSCLRSWKFTPNAALRDCRPRLLHSWPKNCNSISIIRIALQNARVCHLRALVQLPKDDLNEAKVIAKTARGRYKSRREIIEEVDRPYSKEDSMTAQWLSYEVQSSYYGLLASVEPDHAARRTYSCLISIAASIILLTTGFGATVPDGLSPYILAIYSLGLVGAIYGRGRTARWTMPEFEAVDLTVMQFPPTVRQRICGLKEAKVWFGEDVLDV